MSRAARDFALSGIVGSVAPVTAWRQVSVDVPRAVVRELLTVTVLPSGKRGNAFDPELVRIEWRS